MYLFLNMKKAPYVLILVFLLTAPWLAVAQTGEANQAKLKLPWDKLSGLLKIDKKEVRLNWEEFQTLLRHTSQKRVPDFSVSEGDVILTKQEFKDLLNRLIPPPPAVSNIYLTKAVYAGQVKKESVVVKATLHLYVNNPQNKPKEIDVFPGQVAFDDVLLDGSPALTEHKNSRLYITTKKSGHHKIQLTFSINNPKETGTQQLNFPIVRTPITQVQLDIPEPNIDVNITNALKIQTSRLPKGTRVNAVLSPSHHVSLRWNPVVPIQSKGPAKIYAEINHLLSIEDDAIRIQSLINTQVLKNTVNSLTLKLDPGFEVIHVQGDAIGEWEVVDEKNPKLKIPFKYAREGSFQITVTSEKILESNKVAFDFSGFHIHGFISSAKPK